MQVSVEQITIISLLIGALSGLVARKWVPGWVYDEMRADRDEWRKIAEHWQDVAHRAMGVAEKTVRK